MKKILIGAMTLFFLASTSGWVLAQGITTSSINNTSKTTKGQKKGHGCHGKKCNKKNKTSNTAK